MTISTGYFLSKLGADGDQRARRRTCRRIWKTAMPGRGPAAPVYARTQGRPPVQMMPTRIPKASAHAAFILNLTGGMEIPDGRLLGCRLR